MTKKSLITSFEFFHKKVISPHRASAHESPKVAHNFFEFDDPDRIDNQKVYNLNIEANDNFIIKILH